jgi:hypothetical protein
MKKNILITAVGTVCLVAYAAGEGSQFTRVR